MEYFTKGMTKRINKILLMLLLGFFVSCISIKILSLSIFLHYDNYWMGIPVLLTYIIIGYFKIKKIKYISSFYFVGLMGISLSITLLLFKWSYLNSLILNNEEKVILILIIFSLIVVSKILYEMKAQSNDINKGKEQLFNLFYVNTSKVHEIAMLIDNKIMKTVQRSQSSEQLIRHESKMSIGVTDNKKADIGFASESSTKKNVYESFDVKTTKSILLQRIYSVLVNNRLSCSYDLGQIILFNNVELKQKNTDDTVFALNVLKDTNMKNHLEDGKVELNISKIMDEMLKDFTIDYTFEKDDDSYLIRIPFNSKEHFENSYSHNDLQMGQLSVIGIYRGEIDFDSIKSISTKFLEMFADSYNYEINKASSYSDYELQNSSNNNINKPDMKFNIQGNKILGKQHLVDLIAIIQEIQIEEEKKNE